MSVVGTERTRAAPPGSTVVEPIPDSRRRLTSGGALCGQMVSNGSQAVVSGSN